jgi:hypothetical protein
MSTEIQASADRLTAEFAGRRPRDTIERALIDAFRSLWPSKVETFIPLLTERRARSILEGPRRVHP